MSRSRRAPRGNGSEIYENFEVDQTDDNEEDNFVIVDADGNPLDDDTVVAETITQDDHTGDDDDDPHVALQRNYDQLQAERDAAVRERDTYRTQVETSRTTEVEATKAAIASSKQSVEARITAAKQAIQQAGEAQDFSALADAQTELANAQYDLREVTSIEQQFTRESENLPPQRQEPPAQQTHAQRVDAWINTLPEHAQKFTKAHKATLFPENDPKPLQKALATWNYAINVKGLKEGSDEFTDYVEKELGLKQPSETSQPRRTNPAPSQRRPNAAPVKRGGSSQPTQVHLSQAELSMAKRLGMSPKKYAMNKHAATEGAKDPEYRGPRYSKDDPSIVRG